MTRSFNILLILRYIKGFTQKRSHFHVPSVTKHFVKCYLKGAWKDPHRREAISLFILCKGFRQYCQFEEACQHPNIRSHLNAPYVTRYSIRVASWRPMKGPTQERSHSNFPSVTRLFKRVLIRRCIKGLTQERIHLHVPSVTRHLNKGGIWRGMKSTTQNRSHLHVPSVKKLSNRYAN